ncbi:Transcriptional adapter ada2 [Phlyctochytrium bullatum]|nr:Transcriptional adapter ada2 [Phlyctochytrium bullatum]
MLTPSPNTGTTTISPSKQAGSNQGYPGVAVSTNPSTFSPIPLPQQPRRHSIHEAVLPSGTASFAHPSMITHSASAILPTSRFMLPGTSYHGGIAFQRFPSQQQQHNLFLHHQQQLNLLRLEHQQQLQQQAAASSRQGISMSTSQVQQQHITVTDPMSFGLNLQHAVAFQRPVAVLPSRKAIVTAKPQLFYSTADASASHGSQWAIAQPSTMSRTLIPINPGLAVPVHTTSVFSVGPTDAKDSIMTDAAASTQRKPLMDSPAASPRTDHRIEVSQRDATASPIATSATPAATKPVPIHKTQAAEATAIKRSKTNFTSTTTLSRVMVPANSQLTRRSDRAVSGIKVKVKQVPTEEDVLSAARILVSVSRTPTGPIGEEQAAALGLRLPPKRLWIDTSAGKSSAGRQQRDQDVVPVSPVSEDACVDVDAMETDDGKPECIDGAREAAPSHHDSPALPKAHAHVALSHAPAAASLPTPLQTPAGSPLMSRRYLPNESSSSADRVSHTASTNRECETSTTRVVKDAKKDAAEARLRLGKMLEAWEEVDERMRIEGARQAREAKRMRLEKEELEVKADEAAAAAKVPLKKRRRYESVDHSAELRVLAQAESSGSSFRNEEDPDLARKVRLRRSICHIPSDSSMEIDVPVQKTAKPAVSNAGHKSRRYSMSSQEGTFIGGDDATVPPTPTSLVADELAFGRRRKSISPSSDWAPDRRASKDTAAKDSIDADATGNTNNPNSLSSPTHHLKSSTSLSIQRRAVKPPVCPSEVDVPTMFSDTKGAPTITWPKGGPMTFTPDTPMLEKLTKEEKVLCRTLRLMPEMYLGIKEVVLGATFTKGVFKKKDVRRWFPIDVNKINKLYDWFLDLDWIPQKDEEWDRRREWLSQQKKQQSPVSDLPEASPEGDNMVEMADI